MYFKIIVKLCPELLFEDLAHSFLANATMWLVNMLHGLGVVIQLPNLINN